MTQQTKFKIASVTIAATATALLYPAIKSVMFTFLTWFIMQNTVTSRGYSDKAFSRITKGMSEDEALKIAGQPLEIWTYSPGLYAKRNIRPDVKIYTQGGEDCGAGKRSADDCATLVYTMPTPENDMHLIRRLVISNGKVVRIIKEIDGG